MYVCMYIIERRRQRSEQWPSVERTLTTTMNDDSIAASVLLFLTSAVSAEKGWIYYNVILVLGSVNRMTVSPDPKISSLFFFFVFFFGILLIDAVLDHHAHKRADGDVNSSTISTNQHIISMSSAAAHRRTHNLLLISKLLNLHDNASPLILVQDSLEQPAAPLLKEYIRRAKVCYVIDLEASR